MKFQINSIVEMFVGNVLVGISVGVLRDISIGLDPFSTLVSGLSQLTGRDFGLIQMIVSILLMIIQIMLIRKSIGIGTVFNMIFMGFISDWTIRVINHFHISTYITGFKVISVLMCILVIGIGMAAYIDSQKGVATYDSLAMIIVERGNLGFAISRIITDGICLLIGSILGAPFGLATVLLLIGTGPATEYVGGSIIKQFNQIKNQKP